MLAAIPLFVLMAMLLERAGVAEDLYAAMHRWMGPLRGGLAAGTVLICTIMAAMTGLSATGVVTMGLIALPAMLERHYDKNLAAGTIMAAGGLGSLIPPSTVMIYYAYVAEVSIGQLFMGGIIPGLILSGLYIAYILIRSAIQPNLAPSLPPEQRATWKEKFASLKSVILPTLVIVMVLGSIFIGLTTVTEAAAMGVVGALISAAVYRRLNWRLIKEATLRTVRISGMVMWIILAAKCFTALYIGTGAPQLVQDFFGQLPGGRLVPIIIMQLSWMVMGCFLDPAGIVMVTGPLFCPIVKALGFDLVWFGILFIINMEMAYLTPPFGFNLFYMKGVVPEDITMVDLYRSILPFILMQIVCLAIVIMFPQSVLWLPSLMLK